METFEIINLVALITSVVVAAIVVWLMFKKADRASRQRFERSKQNHAAKAIESVQNSLAPYKSSSGKKVGRGVITAH